ncbi:MAK10-like protein [Tanacetum coccineum]|uniref:MAK10-like protein n=1 Tax=Tanacetum coccineum TaxID=301880 RepID=A0ABQ5HP83_9ASTR
MHLHLFHFSLRDQPSNWLERLPVGSITTWKDLTTRILAQFFPPGRTAKLRNDILMFQQHHEESLSKAWTRFKDLLQKVPHHGIDLWLHWNDPRDFAKPVKAIALPQDVPSTSDRRLIELENQVQRLMEAHLALTQPTQVNKITTSCEICSGPHDTQYCMEDPEQAFVEYASSRTDEVGDPQCSNHVQGSINAITINSEKQSGSYDEKAKENKEEEKDSPENIHVNPSTSPDPSVALITEKVLKFNSFFESLGLVPQSSDTEVVCIKGDDGEVMFIELIRKNDDSSEGEPEEEGSKATEGVGAEYFDIFPTRSELAYHKYLMCSLIPSIFLRNPIIVEGCPSNLKIPCNIGHVHRRIKGMHVFVGNFTYIVDFRIVEDISSIINPRLSQVVLGKPFVEIYNMTHDPPEGVVRFTNGTNEVAYKMPQMIEQYNSLSDLEKEHTKSIYLRNKEDKRRGVEYVIFDEKKLGSS